MSALDRVTSWPVPHSAAAIVRSSNGSTPATYSTVGETDRSFRLASLTKTVTGLTALIACEEGSLRLDDVIDPAMCSASLHEGTTLRHLLAHASGLPFDGAAPITALGRRRIYSNTGIEMVAELITASTGIAFDDYLNEAVIEPLGMTSTELRGSPAFGLWSTIDDMALLLSEYLQPSLISPETHADFITEQFTGIAGTIPGLGRFDPCPWGLGVELRGAKDPHWTGTQNAPSTFGHFGGAGTMMWVDPSIRTGLVALTDRPFDEWSEQAISLWSELSDATIEEIDAFEAAS
ncbi:MAG: serine hydrolase domain-containing protein [Ilumatobacteraceae bacterium]